ncbi:MAG: methylated-DNA--[protein]-cysteine S-methyltransferase [Flammeovirgaceae bacterium]
MDEEKSYCHFQTPLGWLQIIGTATSIESVQFHDEAPSDQSLFIPKILQNCQIQLEEYLTGKRNYFDNLPLAPQGSIFQQSVWKQLQGIPFGKTTSYLQIAQQLGDRNAVRAVGAANGNNPIAIIIPCHRVIGSDGSLTGYAGGLWRKRWLLEHEQEVSGAERQLKLF